MFSKIGLVPVIAAASFLLLACDPKPAEAPANDAAPAAVTEANGAAPAAATEADSATSAGRSAPTGGDCGGIAGLSCSSDKEYCKIPDGQCDVADAMGTCTVRPEI